jgi:hypothetical protein
LPTLEPPKGTEMKSYEIDFIWTKMNKEKEMEMNWRKWHGSKNLEGMQIEETMRRWEEEENGKKKSRGREEKRKRRKEGDKEKEIDRE